MMHKAWSSIEEVPYCFSRSYVKLQGHTALKIVKFDPNWAFSDCNSSFNSPLAMKCCTKLETAKEGCPIVFQGHPSNFKVTRYKTSPILTQIGRFRTIGRSQLSNPSDLPCFMRCTVIFLMHGYENMLDFHLMQIFILVNYHYTERSITFEWPISISGKLSSAIDIMDWEYYIETWWHMYVSDSDDSDNNLPLVYSVPSHYLN